MLNCNIIVADVASIDNSVNFIIIIMFKRNYTTSHYSMKITRVITPLLVSQKITNEIVIIINDNDKNCKQ